jgi:membrane-bound metal-dependent hydrolase YbcI (DUF457 family)
MFIGHFGVGFGAKKIIAKPSLGTIFLASQFIDLLWPLFLLLGIEQVKIDPGNTVVTPLNFINYPFSHSLIGVLIWAILFGGVYYIIKKDLKVAIWLGVLVCSHWILDLITHRPDLPLLFNNETMVGMGLWNSLIATIIVEGSIFAAGIYFYMKVTSSNNRTGTIALWSLIGFLAIIYISNLFGPPPPSEGPIGIIGLSQWLIIAWAYWIDKNRTVV